VSCIDHGFVGDKDGYSQKDLGRGKRKPFRHRLAYAAYYGLDEAKLGGVVLHSCDNSRCINPLHLRLGTHQDNVADKVAKGRQARGSRHGASKLTEIQVAEIRRRYVRRAKGEPGNAKQLLTEFGISQGNLSFIVNNVTRTS
jgi:hypothetical protein